MELSTAGGHFARGWPLVYPGQPTNLNHYVLDVDIMERNRKDVFLR